MEGGSANELQALDSSAPSEDQAARGDDSKDEEEEKMSVEEKGEAPVQQKASPPPSGGSPPKKRQKKRDTYSEYGSGSSSESDAEKQQNHKEDQKDPTSIQDNNPPPCKKCTTQCSCRSTMVVLSSLIANDTGGSVVLASPGEGVVTESNALPETGQTESLTGGPTQSEVTMVMSSTHPCYDGHCVSRSRHTLRWQFIVTLQEPSQQLPLNLPNLHLT